MTGRRPAPTGGHGTPARDTPSGGDRAARWLARTAIATAAVAVGLLVGVGGFRSVVLAAVAVAGAGTGLAGAWAALAYRGGRRAVAAAVAVLAPVAVLTLYAWSGLLLLALVCAGLWAVAVAAAAAALPHARTAEHTVAAPPHHPFLIMNPRSGGGKVGKHDLARKARALGADVVLLDGARHVDVTELARRAVRDGADLLGVAGGDGTQAEVARVAVEHGVPFLVIAAGTRNHFAMDLGLDRADPAAALDALTDGVELRVDVGWAGDRMFVNNASFGAYAAVVQSPGYREDKVATALQVLPDLLGAEHGPGLRLHAGPADVAGAQAVLVSNNPYATSDIAGLGRRERLDGGVLGVLAVTVSGAADAARLVRGTHSQPLTRAAAGEAVIEADTPSIPAGVDGESVVLPTPVRCHIQPGALRVRVPRHRPARRPRPQVDWRRLGRLAFSTGRGRRP
ncbi:NAD(+)/NADH kinase [Dactylosporangium aurantiacum]|uniref:NAD(+)/NADH kinase n=1 Tax=Dactylosporangium aurantiacum TaxID=35754 RepID=A0A9Q9MRW2_9ACTN|nr:diacylglycerol kinase family protein [Dactylosporangium aurantiacum]MDG6103909.1 diacylglycerol kinase family protein [Dactylosporangium aurantiacum]UWZ58902.1 NAD(+)/NADH kinase [Dactylosporangium aurantiacum]